MLPHRSEDTVLMIRMWREPGLPHDGSDWRGRVDLLTEGKRKLFVGADSLRQILDICLQGDGPDRCTAVRAPDTAPHDAPQNHHVNPDTETRKTC
jgi:hypothetical protein